MKVRTHTLITLMTREGLRARVGCSVWLGPKMLDIALSDWPA